MHGKHSSKPQNDRRGKTYQRVAEQNEYFFKSYTEEEKEDLGLLIMIKEVDRNDTVPRDEIMNKLSS